MQTLAATCDIQRHAKFARSTYFECWVLNKIVQQQDQVDVHMIQKSHADLGGVQVVATLPTGPVCVQWRQQQLISGALFHVGIGKRDISSEERALTGQKYLLKMKRHNCQVMCSALNGFNSWSLALFYMSISGKAVFSEKAHCQVHLICWRYITQSPSEVLISVGWKYQSHLHDTSEKAVSVNAKWEVQQRQQKADLFKLKCSWSKRRRGHLKTAKLSCELSFEKELVTSKLSYRCFFGLMTFLEKAMLALKDLSWPRVKTLHVAKEGEST